MPGGGDEDPWLREGHLHEADVIRQLEEQGYDVSGRQRAVQLDVLDSRIVGHLDGDVARPGERPRVLEVKALGKNTFAEAEAMGPEEYFKHHKGYGWQLSGAMWATGQQAKVAVKSRDSGKLLIEDIDQPFYEIADFEQRMKEIQEWVDADRLPPCEKSGFCWKGPYRHIHYKEDGPSDPIPLHETRNSAIEDVSEKLYDARLKRKAAEEVEENLKDELLGMAGEGVYLTEHHKVTIREIKSSRVDQKKVREDHGDKYDVETKYPNVRIDPRG